jgi:hypothetical protein
MLLSNHHDWVNFAATRVMLGGEILWQALCAIWADSCLGEHDAKEITQPIDDVLIGVLIA